MAVAVGVVEEKVSRIVEILRATVKPAQLLWGKILGIGIVQIASTLVLAAVGLVTARATGLLTIPDVAYSMVGVSMIWLLLGFLFFAALYAATGAMVSRQEEINSAAWPLMIVAMGAMYAGIFGISAPDSGVMRVLAWIPPFSSTVVPMRVATGYGDWVEVAGSALLMALVTAFAVWISGQIYRRSVLMTGSRVSWKKALGR
jgi:ABC-2 type transport system permease protein